MKSTLLALWGARESAASSAEQADDAGRAVPSEVSSTKQEYGMIRASLTHSASDSLHVQA